MKLIKVNKPKTNWGLFAYHHWMLLPDPITHLLMENFEKEYNQLIKYFKEEL